MSSFSGLSTALSSLIAQRQALDVAGQNIANANTVGYTRQRADLTSVQALSAPTMFSTGSAAGNGVRAAGISRLGDIFLDARVNAETSNAGFQSARAVTLEQLQSSITEPADTGLAASLQTFWAGWQDVSNTPDSTASRQVLLGDAAAVVSQVASGYRSVETQWNQIRTQADTMVTDVNATAASIADLNEQIRSILVSGGSANELIDQRNQSVTKLAGLVGATGREQADGTMDVMVGGNALVRGNKVNPVALNGSFTMSAVIAEPPDATAQIRLTWAGSSTPLTLEGGQLASYVADLAPASAGGVLASAVATWNSVATSLATTVNAIHATGQTLGAPPNDTGVEFFALASGSPPALGLSVAVTDPSFVAAGDPTKGALDGSIADAISRLSTASNGPDQLWSNAVVDLGVQTRTATSRSSVVEAARASAERLQLSQSSVDVDEELVNMQAFQRAYEGAARVLTAIDEMLDVLINRTGLVGR